MASPRERAPWFLLAMEGGSDRPDTLGMELAKELRLSVICPRCGIAFESAMQMDPKTFERIRLAKQLECCPACKHVGRFQKPDYLFRSHDG